VSLDAATLRITFRRVAEGGVFAPDAGVRIAKRRLGGVLEDGGVHQVDHAQAVPSAYGIGELDGHLVAPRTAVVPLHGPPHRGIDELVLVVADGLLAEGEVDFDGGGVGRLVHVVIGVAIVTVRANCKQQGEDGDRDCSG